MDHIQAIEVGLQANASYNEIARKIYLTYPTKAFFGTEEQQYLILNSIAEKFGVPITTIQIAGSAKTGRSFHQKTDFKPGSSDLDVAIIDSRLFVRYTEIVFAQSKGYSDLSKFPLREGKSTYEEYVRYVSRGMFRPDLMTYGTERADWTSFFGRLSTRHTSLFGAITACIYLSESFFESKQRSAIKSYIDNRAV